MRNLFIGDSITEGFPTDILLSGKSVTNRGISGISSIELLRLFTESWVQSDTVRTFICIGTNDLARNITDTQIIESIKIMCSKLGNQSVYLTSLFPTKRNKPRPNKRIDGLNLKIHELSVDLDAHFLHMNPLFKDETGSLRNDYTNDGLHLTFKAYEKWAALISDLLI